MKKLLVIVPLVLVAGGAGVYWYANQRARTEVDARLQRLVESGAYDALEYENLNVTANGDIAMSNLHVTKDGNEVVLQNIKVTNLDCQHEVPWTMNLTIDGFAFPQGLPDIGPDQSEAAMRFLESYVANDTLPMSVNYAYEYQPDNASQIDSRMSVHLDEGFTLDASGTMRGVPLETLMNLEADADADPLEAQAQAMQLIATAEFPAADWRLKDEGILDELIVLSAEETGTTPDQVRAGMISQVRNMYLFMPQPAQGFGMETGIQLAGFLEGGKTLSVKLAPEYGGSFQRLQQEIMTAAFTMDIPKIAELLHLEIKTE